MVETIDMVFEGVYRKTHSPDVTSLDVKARIKQWFNSRYPSITLH